MSVRVVSAYFVDIYKDGNGGAIEVSGKLLLVSFCFFTNLSVSTHGGSISCNNSYCKIKKSCFYRSYSTKHKNDAGFGNAIFANKHEIVCDNINIRKCGPSADLGSDSSFKTSNCLNKIENYNASCNYGLGGASGISIIGAIEVSSIRFMNVVDAFDSSAIESSKIYYVNNSNFINTKGCLRSFLWESANNQISFDTCIFIQSKSPFSSIHTITSNTIEYSAVNCIADESIDMITYQINPKTNYITIKIINMCSIDKRKSKSLMLLFQIILLLSC